MSAPTNPDDLRLGDVISLGDSGDVVLVPRFLVLNRADLCVASLDFHTKREFAETVVALALLQVLRRCASAFPPEMFTG